MWTTAVSEGSVKFDMDDEKASFHVKDVLVFDSFTVPNALNSFHPNGHVNAMFNSLRMEWSGTTKTRSWPPPGVCGEAFRGTFFEDVATIEVTATTPPTPARSCPPTPARHGFKFVSDPAETSVSHFAQIGRESNGVFF